MGALLRGERPRWEARRRMVRQRRRCAASGGDHGAAAAAGVPGWGGALIPAAEGLCEAPSGTGVDRALSLLVSC